MDGSADPALASILDELWPGGAAHATPLDGGITNRNFTVEVGAETFVLRLAGQGTELLGIDREAEAEAARMAAATGVGPEVVVSLPSRGILVTRFIEGEPIPVEELEHETTLALVVRSVRSLHAGPPIRSSFPVFRIVEGYRDVAAAHRVAIPDRYEEAHAFAERIERALETVPAPLIPCHNDLLNANLLRQDDRIWVVDYEYAGMGDAFFDLGNFSINNGLSTDAQEILLQLYVGDVHDRDRARLGLMRIMSDFREAMWGVVQQGLSTLDFDYVSYAEAHFARLAASAADPRFDEWLRVMGTAS